MVGSDRKAIFREYDIRGIYGEELDEETVRKIGYHLAQRIRRRIPQARYVAVGYDARLHSPTLFAWLASGINSAGLGVLGMGMVPTPVNYFVNYQAIGQLVQNSKFRIQNPEAKPDASVMITGSHNPPEYNGFKITVGREPFFGEEIYALGRAVAEGGPIEVEKTEILPIDAVAPYVRFMLREFSALGLTGRRFIFDCGNGAAGVVLRRILEGLGIEFEILFEKPDGTFPNHHPDPSDSETLETLREHLATGEYTLGFAYDGDADRLAVLSPKHEFKGDILAIFFSRFIDNPTVIGEVKCSQLMYDTINRHGRAIMYKTGHSNLKRKIKEAGADLAAEVSGHLFFNDRYYGYDDAIYGTLRVLELVAKGFDLDAEYEKLPRLYSTEEINIDTTEERKFRIIQELKSKLAHPPTGFPPIREIITIDGLRVVFDKGWGLIRASNTTPKLVTRFEATDEATARHYQEALLGLVNHR